jgi:hypothetical protein
MLEVEPGNCNSAQGQPESLASTQTYCRGQPQSPTPAPTGDRGQPQSPTPQGQPQSSTAAPTDGRGQPQSPTPAPTANNFGMDKVIGNHYPNLVATISGDLVNFCNKFIKCSFITQDQARATRTKLGISDQDKAAELLCGVVTSYINSRNKEEWAKMFIALFTSESAYAELGESLRKADIN